MTNPIRVLLSVLITIIVIAGTYTLILVYKPSWLDKLKYDKNGFPRFPKQGDKFSKANNNIYSDYIYTNGKWELVIISKG